MDSRRLNRILIGLHITAFILSVMVLAVLGTAWGQALVRVQFNGLYESDYSTGRRLQGWLSYGYRGAYGLSGGGNYVSNYVYLVYATAAISLYWTAFFCLMRVVPALHIRTFGKAPNNYKHRSQWSLFELIATAVWWVMWLASAAGMSSTEEAKAATKGVKGLGALQACLAFLWLGWLVWSAIVAVSAMHYRTNRRCLGATPPRASNAGAAPAGPCDLEAQHHPHHYTIDSTHGTDQDKLSTTAPYPKQGYNGGHQAKPGSGGVQMFGLTPNTHGNAHYVPSTPTSQPPNPAAVQSVRQTPHWEPPMTAGAAAPGADDIAAVVWKTQTGGNAATAINPFR